MHHHSHSLRLRWEAVRRLPLNLFRSVVLGAAVLLFSVSTAWGIPLNLSASASSSSQINLSWEEDYPYYEDYTLVQRSPNGSSWTTMAKKGTDLFSAIPAF